jgi:hypothetical protein
MVNKQSEQGRFASDREAVVCLPTGLLFFETVTLPAAVETDEIADFVELTLEERSPFPLRDLCYGFLYEPHNRGLLIYAAIRRRVEQLFPGALEKARFMLPGFCLLHGLQSHANKALLLECDDSQSLLNMDAHGLPVPAEKTQVDNAESPIHLRLDNIEWTKEGSLEASFEQLAPHPEQTLAQTLSVQTLWAADVRDADFKRLERSRRNRERQLMQAIALGGWAALFLLVSQIGLWGLSRHVDNRMSERERLQPAVLSVQDRHSLLTTLEQVTAAELRPLDVLEAMNRLRPDAIHFTEMRAEGQNRITVEGIAGSVNALNRYAESLTESGEFRVGDPRTLVRAGRTTFTLTVDYTGPLPVLAGTASVPGSAGREQP